jgi:SAM-dependent methyltransferase
MTPADQNMSEAVAGCPLCGSTHSEPFDRRTFRGYPVTNRICASCGLVYQSPHMSDQELGVFYEQEYRQLYQGNEGPNPKDLATQKGRADALLAFVGDRLPSIRRHLDLGCSAGLLLNRFQTAFETEPVGVEPGNAYRAYAQEQGLKVYASLDELEASGEARFDLVSMAHVLEHIASPAEYLAQLRENRMVPDSWLLIEVPNIYAHDCFEVAHLVSYSAHTLQQTLKRAGFEIFAFQQHGQPRSNILPLYLTVLARPSKGKTPFQIVPETGVKRKRQFGMLRRRLLTRLFPRKAWLPARTS